ncbi:hypothetical protein ACFL51_00505, partial [Myxococcota bacterium]
CPWGYMEILGETECQPIGDCGTGTWGLIEIDATTVFVDASADATGADGSQGAPYVTIQEAYDVVVPGGQIAVAAGEYEERLVINKEVRLTGRCAELVTIRGGWLVVAQVPVTIAVEGSGTTIRGVTLTGDVEGIKIFDAVGITVAEVQIVEAGSYGLWAENAGLSVINLVASANYTLAIILWGTDAELSSVVVQDTLPQQSDGTAGYGIQASCDPASGVCSSLRLDHALIEANHASGIALIGTDAELSSVVVRDTLPQQSDGTAGTGLHATCDPDTGVCSSLRLDRVLLLANHAKGIVLFGTEAELSSVVVRDTLPRQIDDAAGVGLQADCYTDVGVCSSLRLDHALLQANHQLGIALFGTEAEITSVVVRDTLPQQSDGTFGIGLNATYDPEMSVSGSLRLDDALIEANQASGIALGGTEAEIFSVVIRDTLPQSQGKAGFGLQAASDPETGVYGSLRLDHALIEANHAIGLGLWGIEAEISSVVVRDTRPQQSDGTFGTGLNAICDSGTGVCSSLRLDHALLQANHQLGIALDGAEADLYSVVVRETQPQQGSGKFGYGLSATCDRDTGVCGRLRLDHAVLEANHAVGLGLSGVDADISSIVLRDILPQQSDGKGGTGLEAACDPDWGVCGSLRLDHALFQANHAVGIALFGTDADLSLVVIRDTLPQQSGGTFGTGLQAACDDDWSVCGSLQASGSLIQRSSMFGIGVFGVPAELSGVAVVDTRQNEEGDFAGEDGIGVFARCDQDTCATLDMTSCLVDSSFSAGVAIKAVSGSIVGSMISTVAPRALDGAFGYGIQVEGIPGAPPTVLHVSDSLIQDAELAGILYYLAGGTVSGSQITGGQYTVVMNQGANPVIQDDNDLSGSIESEPEWASMDPAPAPGPVPPADIIEQFEP